MKGTQSVKIFLIRIVKVLFIITTLIIVGFVYGYFVHRNKIFPYKQINSLVRSIHYRANMQWSIGVFIGDSPFNIKDEVTLRNPVISKRDINSINAAFVADPFVVEEQNKFFMFFEVLNSRTVTGDIGLAESTDGKSWTFKKIVLDEDFHLSYPSIIKWNGDYFMIPESIADSSVRIYKAESFPEKWVFVKEILSGVELVDPTVFYHNEKFWMFLSNRGSNQLHLYFSDNLFSGWKPHPMNPLRNNDPHFSRPAGPVFMHESKLYRVAQDCAPYYGLQVYAIEIRVLSENDYVENSDDVKKVLSGSGSGWNSEGMHHIDLYNVGEQWISVVDGIKRRN